MPFLMEADEFARRAATAMIAGVRYRTIPWQMGWVSGLLKFLPRSAFDRLMKNRKQKPRIAPS